MACRGEAQRCHHDVACVFKAEGVVLAALAPSGGVKRRQPHLEVRVRVRVRVRIRVRVRVGVSCWRT